MVPSAHAPQKFVTSPSTPTAEHPPEKPALMKLSILLACTLCLVTLNCLVSLAISDQDWVNAVRTHYKTYGIDTPPREPQNSEM